MKLAVSSIAWSPSEENEVAQVMNGYGLSSVELAPTKIWDDPTKATDDQIEEVVGWWSDRGISIDAFQSMLFSRPDLKLFQDESRRAGCLEYLKDFTVLAGKMGAKRMIFGSPKNRQRNGMSYEQAFELATGFFREIGEVAVSNGVIFCIEPNAPQYNCDFVTNAKQGADLVTAVNHPGFGLHLDTACMALAGDDVYASIREYSDMLRHFHVSSPMLEQVEERSDVPHEIASKALHEIGYEHTVSIEMRPDEEGRNVGRVDSAVQFAQKVYLA